MSRLSTLEEQLNQRNTDRQKATRNQAVSVPRQELTERVNEAERKRKKDTDLQKAIDEIVSRQELVKRLDNAANQIRKNEKYIKEAEEEISNLREVISLDLNSAEFYHQRGVVFLDLGDKNEALANLRKAAILFHKSKSMDNYESVIKLIEETEK